MAGLIPPFDPTAVTAVSQIVLTLPDTDVLPGQVMARPGIARYANAALSLTKLTVLSGTIDVLCPAMGTVRKINLNAGESAGLIADNVNELLEISLLPFFIEPILRSIPGGVPTFYLGIPDPEPFEENSLIAQGQQLGQSGVVYVGAIFQDRLCLELWGWAAIIAQAITATGGDASPWTTFIDTLYPVNGRRVIKILDHVGLPHPPTQFQITVNGQEQTLNSDASAILVLPLPVGVAGQLSWSGNPHSGETTALPVMSLYETATSASPDTTLIIPADFMRGHIQLLDLANWFSAPVSEPEVDRMKRYHTNSKVEPLVDGYKTFRLIAQDMIACKPATDNSDDGTSGAHFAGWAFKNFVLDETLVRAGTTPDEETNTDNKPYTYEELVKFLAQKNADGDIQDVRVRALVNKLFSIPGDLDDIALENALGLSAIITTTILFTSLLNFVESDETGKLIVLGGQLLATISAMIIASELPPNTLNKFIEEKTDQSGEMFGKFNEILSGMAIRSIHPALNQDNPLFTPITLNIPAETTITDFITGVGTWHQKIQLFKRASGTLDSEGNQFIGYVGGMDMNGNRLDNFGRQGKSAYHDVHSRITGPAVSDVFKTWADRHAYEKSLMENNDAPGPLFTTPDAVDVPLQTDKNPRHIVQIGRTYFRPMGPDTNHALPFATGGDNSINQNIVRAIREAREYIYIEDQYFVPNKSETGEAYRDLLLAAADHCKRLIVVSPSIMSLADLPFGQERRGEVVADLLTHWGSRALIGAPMRRPILPSPGNITHEGRCILYAEIQTTDTSIKIGPKTRLPKAFPFWLWINGELMLALNLTDNGERIDSHPVVDVNVLRGSGVTAGGWGATTRKHPKGSAVTASQLRGIFVHAKTMMVDDTHVYIGSSNINRRGLFYDGEIGVFAVPEQLKAAPDNPAKQLRTELWAEQLGLPPSMGMALLQDPIAAFDLFRRSFYEGNRFVPLSLFDLNDDSELQASVSTNLLGDVLLNAGIWQVINDRKAIYNTLVDPTTMDDPANPV